VLFDFKVVDMRMLFYSVAFSCTSLIQFSELSFIYHLPTKEIIE